LLLLVECVCDPEHPAVSEPHDLAALGRLYHKRGQLDRAVDYFERASLHSREQDLTNRVLSDLARIYKKLGRHSEAVDLWEAECRRAGIKSTVAYVELLKLLEHDTKDYARAMELITHAEQQIGERAHYTALELQAELTKRRGRIEKKLAKGK
jgi:tetratricopeptide (TPR) repeat protein